MVEKLSLLRAMDLSNNQGSIITDPLRNADAHLKNCPTLKCHSIPTLKTKINLIMYFSPNTETDLRYFGRMIGSELDLKNFKIVLKSIE